MITQRETEMKAHLIAFGRAMRDCSENPLSKVIDGQDAYGSVVDTLEVLLNTRPWVEIPPHDDTRPALAKK